MPAGDDVTNWSIEYEGDRFEKFLLGLPQYEQAVLVAAIEHVLAVHGIDVCAGEWGKPLGGGLYEFRVRRSLGAILRAAGVEDAQVARDSSVLLRVFCTFTGARVVLLLGGYDKGRDPSAKRQQREIERARRIHRAWRARTFRRR